MTKKLTGLLLTYFAFLVKAEDPVLVILAGSSRFHDTLNTSLIIGLQNDYECNIADLKDTTFGAIGGMIGSQMIYCGGRNGKYGIGATLNNCSYYDPDSNLWMKTDSEHDMKDSRYWAGYTSTDHGLLVTGGSYGVGLCSTRNTAEYLSKANGTWESLPDVPFYSYQSCLVELNSTHTLLIGGYSDTECIPNADPTNKVLAFNWETKKWTEIEPMKESRIGAMCARLNDGKVIVAGGYDDHRLKSTEIFDPVTQTWTSGPDLPLYWDEGKLVSYGNGALLVTGFTQTDPDDVYSSKSEDKILLFEDNQWIEFPKKLPPYGRYNAVVFIADGDYLDLAKNCRNSSSKPRTFLSAILFCLTTLLLTK